MAVERYESLNGAEKAAILMLSVGEDSAAKLFSMLDLEEVMDISQTMSLLGRVDADIVERLLREFGDRLSTPGGVIGGFETTEKLLLRFFDPQRVENIMEEIRGPAGRTVWDKLGNVNETVLASYLKTSNYPQAAPAMAAPSLMSMRRDHPRHITVLPGGGSEARAGCPPTRPIRVR